MDDNSLIKYSSHIFLPEIDEIGQEKILQAKVLLIGLGGLGSHVGLNLARAGIQNFTLVDNDVITLSNLSRQVLFFADDIGEFKTKITKRELQKINNNINIEEITDKFDEKLFQDTENFDVIIDATDNFTTRYAINEFAVKKKTPLVTGAAINWQGQMAVFLNDKYSACYQCLYGKNDPRLEDSIACSLSGVITPLVAIIGAMQAMESLKIIVNANPAKNKLLTYNAIDSLWQSLNLQKARNCICSN